jgi:hypothetical protein
MGQLRASVGCQIDNAKVELSEKLLLRCKGFRARSAPSSRKCRFIYGPTVSSDLNLAKNHRFECALARPD